MPRFGGVTEEMRASFRGFVAIYTVLIVLAVVTAVAITVGFLAIGESQGSFALTKGEQALFFVEGCTEDLLVKVRDSPAFSGTTITRPEGTCSISYALSGPISWDATVTTTAADYKRRVRVIFTRNSSSITLISWREV